MTPEARKLFLEISRCQVMVATLNGEQTPCEKVVLCQCPTLEPEDRRRVWERKHHLPVPWVGHIEEAPLLILSSNPFVRRSYDGSPAPPPQEELDAFRGATIAEHPSLGRPFEAPKAEWKDEQIVDKGEAMFDVWTEPTGRRAYIDKDGNLGDESPYWKAAYAFASSMFDAPARPGVDYALTEIVRCKSPDEEGVEKATNECVGNYLDDTLRLSPAPVVAVFGRRARQVVRGLTGYADYGPVTPTFPLAGRDRTFVFLGHPNARKPKYPKELDEQTLSLLRERLSTGDPGLRYRSEARDVEITRMPGGEK